TPVLLRPCGILPNDRRDRGYATNKLFPRRDSGRQHHFPPRRRSTRHHVRALISTRGSHPRRAGRTFVLAYSGRRGRDVLVEPEEVVRVVHGLHRRQPLIGAVRIGRPHPLPALVGEEVHIRSPVALADGGGELRHPRPVERGLGGIVVDGRHVGHDP